LLAGHYYARDDDEVEGTVVGMQFRRDSLNMGAIDRRAEGELPGDLLVGVALGGQRHHVALRGQVGRTRSAGEGSCPRRSLPRAG
jgi:hypothetical protein